VNRFRWVVRWNPPTELSLINGDIWYNLRSSLDYLVWQLVLRCGGEPTNRTAFPCVKKREDWAGAAGNQLPGVLPEWAASIEKLQPYNGSDGLNKHPLFLLDWFNNFNKHRLMPPTVVTTAAVAWMMPADALPNKAHVTVLPGRVEKGAEFLRFGSPDRIVLPEMDVDPGSEFRISWDDGLGFEWDLETVVEWVEQAILIFEPAFKG